MSEAVIDTGAMRRLLGTVVAVLIVGAGCTAGSDDGSDDATPPTPTPSRSVAAPVTLDSLNLDWPDTEGVLETGELPDAPDGFDDQLLARMAEVLSEWAAVTTVDSATWSSASPIDDLAGVVPDEVGDGLRDLSEDAVSPRLAVGNVFGDGVEVVGEPKVTTAWRVSTESDDDGQEYVLLELQTRAAYEVKRDGGPSRVIGVLRVHGLSAYPETTDDFGVSAGWQEFGAGSCSLAVDDALVPDNDVAKTTGELRTFVEVGDGDEVEMPDLGDEQRVDAEYLQRCRDSMT